MAIKQNYKRISKDMPSGDVENMLNVEFNNGWKVIYYDERIMSTDNVWVTVVLEKNKKSFL